MDPARAVVEKTVMVVDDDPAVCELIQEILSPLHYHVLVVHDGLEAIETTNHHHIDLILMDIRMPFFSGFWFCDAFRRKKNTCNIPVVIVSAMMDEENAERARCVGAVDTVKKPFTMEQLLQTVEKNSL
jgi:CheY-like chemotaxis protein